MFAITHAFPALQIAWAIFILVDVDRYEAFRALVEHTISHGLKQYVAGLHSYSQYWVRFHVSFS